MSTPEVPTAAEILQSLNLLRSADPTDRARGVDGLSRVPDDPRVLQVFEHLYRDDPDPRVRYAAWLALSRRGPSVPAPGPTAAPVRTSPAAALAPIPSPANSLPSVTDHLDWFAEPLPPPVPSPAAAAPIAPPPLVLPPPDPRPSQPLAGARLWSATAPGGLFLFDPKHKAVIARERARRKSDGCGYVLVGALMLGLMAGLWALVLPDLLDWYRLRLASTTVTGTMIRVDQRQDTPVALYSFAVPGQEAGTTVIVAAQPVTREAAATLQPGVPIPVTYWRDHPARLSAIPVENPDHLRRDWMTGIAGSISALALVLLALGLNRRLQRLRQPRRVLPGQVVLCTGRLDDDGDYKIKLRYRFKSPAGRVINAQRTAIRNDLRQMPLPQPGATVAVYYHSDRKYWLL